MLFLKNIQFTQLIKINGHLKEFNFRKPNGHLKTMFTIDTMDNSNSRITFNMQQDADGWILVQQGLPEWIQENESQLNKVIKQELDGSEIYFKLPVSQHVGHWNRLFGIFGMG